MGACNASAVDVFGHDAQLLTEFGGNFSTTVDQNLRSLNGSKVAEECGQRLIIVENVAADLDDV